MQPCQGHQSCTQVPYPNTSWTFQGWWLHHCQGLITLLMKTFSLIFNLNLPGQVLGPFPLVLSLVAWEQDLHLAALSCQGAVESTVSTLLYMESVCWASLCTLSLFPVDLFLHLCWINWHSPLALLTEGTMWRDSELALFFPLGTCHQPQTNKAFNPVTSPVFLENKHWLHESSEKHAPSCLGRGNTNRI